MNTHCPDTGACDNESIQKIRHSRVNNSYITGHDSTVMNTDYTYTLVCGAFEEQERHC